jgi:hydroxymethylpyrimidine kinase/phosphomethylpyrimidine kinase
MSERNRIAIALTIAGSDSGGGAGIQADLKTFAALGVHGTSAITCVTAQNPRRVLGIEPCRPDTVRLQLQAVFDELPAAAAKAGMLHSAAIIRVVARFFQDRPRTPLVVDPVMIATSGARLIATTAVNVLRDELLPAATLVTPNIDEAGLLIGRRLRSVEDLRFAAREIQRRFGCAALVKGGHLGGLREAADIFFDGRTELLLTAPFVRGLRTHGTGCVYSAAITAYLAQGFMLAVAVARAKEFITAAIAGSRKAGGHWVLDTACAGGKR